MKGAEKRIFMIFTVLGKKDSFYKIHYHIINLIKIEDSIFIFTHYYGGNSKII